MVLPLLVTAPAMPVVADAETTAHASQGTPNHTVRAGETIYDIAARYHVSPAALLSRNHLSAPGLHPAGAEAAGSRPHGVDLPLADHVEAGALRLHPLVRRRAAVTPSPASPPATA
uniref:LysM peptidoglycan-binding domain-containing protein n=1 Tax=Janibacter limosus TaxID=53458 RepID=A0AC61U7M8_9MICO|nr:LysM peptidoglycan-binding domain-containing protein [Janibacter limosus]